MPEKSIKEVKNEYEDSLFELEGVTVVAIGEIDGQPCITVMLEKDSDSIRGRIPQIIEGYPVKILVSGPVHSQGNDL